MQYLLMAVAATTIFGVAANAAEDTTKLQPATNPAAQQQGANKSVAPPVSDKAVQASPQADEASRQAPEPSVK